MPTVTGIEDVRGFISIAADGHTIARIRKSHFAKCPVELGEEIDIDQYFGRLSAVQFSDAYETALTCLDFSQRSSREIAMALKRKGYVPPVVEAIVAKLEENHLLDDRRYAQRIAESQSSKPVGIYAVKRKLRAKGFSEEDVDAAMEDGFDEEQQREAALQTARKLYRKYESLPAREARAKLSQALARRGFSWDSIESAVESLID